jgi:hypothetical protein
MPFQELLRQDGFISLYRFLHEGVIGCIMSKIRSKTKEQLIDWLMQPPADFYQVFICTFQRYLRECFLRALEGRDPVVMNLIFEVPMPIKCIFRTILVGADHLLKYAPRLNTEQHFRFCRISPSEITVFLRKYLSDFYVVKLAQIRNGPQNFQPPNYYISCEYTLKEYRQLIRETRYRFLDEFDGKNSGNYQRDYSTGKYPSLPALLSEGFPG